MWALSVLRAQSGIGVGELARDGHPAVDGARRMPCLVQNRGCFADDGRSRG